MMNSTSPGTEVVSKNRDELLKAIAARISLSLHCLNNSDTERVADLLERLVGILPTPEQRHLDAANGCRMEEVQNRGR